MMDTPTCSHADLSDDEVVGAVATGGWEEGAQAVQDIDDAKKVRMID